MTYFYLLLRVVWYQIEVVFFQNKSTRVRFGGDLVKNKSTEALKIENGTKFWNVVKSTEIWQKKKIIAIWQLLIIPLAGNSRFPSILDKQSFTVPAYLQYFFCLFPSVEIRALSKKAISI